MLALLYKIATKTALVLLNDLFELDLHPPLRSGSRSSKSRHRLCLIDPGRKIWLFLANPFTGWYLFLLVPLILL